MQITPGRTLDAIKGVRKSKRYQELLASSQREADGRELIEREPAPDSGPPNVIPDSPTSGIPVPQEDWAAELRDAIYQLSVPDGIELAAIIPGKPTMATREMIDVEYAWWLSPLAGPEIARPPRQGPRDPRVRIGKPSNNARARRRAAYAHTQQGSAVLATSFPVPGRRSLPQYRLLYRSRTGVACSSRHRSEIQDHLCRKNLRSGPWFPPSRWRTLPGLLRGCRTGAPGRRPNPW